MTLVNRSGSSCLYFVFISLLAGCSDTTERAVQAWFNQATHESGISFIHQSGAHGEYLLPEIMGSGVALFDVENDGDLDIYLVQSGALTDTAISAINQLYLNDGNGYFTLAEDTGLESNAYGMGVTTGDIDDDGFVDLYVTNVGTNELFRNRGDGTFEEITEQAGVGIGGFSTATLFADFDNDSDLDLFVSNYVDWTPSSEIKCFDYGTGARNYCDPGNYDRPTSDFLFKNNGDGTYLDVSTSSGIDSVKGNGLGAVATDFNADGLLDIYVANDKTPNHLWINRGNLKFVDEAFVRNAAMDDQGIAKAGMGVVAADLDYDADMDVIVVNIQTETDSVYRNEVDYFVDATARFGLTQRSRNFTRFGIVVSDFNSDGWVDIYQANGKVSYSPESEVADSFAEQNLLFVGQPEGRFEVQNSLKIQSERLIHTSRALAVGDLNSDGAIDLVVTNRDSEPYILINQYPSSERTYNIKLVRASGSPDLHAKVILSDTQGKQLMREVQVAGSYLAANSPTISMSFPENMLFTDVLVQWSDGTRENYALRDFPPIATVQRGLGLVHVERD